MLPPTTPTLTALLLMTLTGDRRVQFTPSGTKELAAHAGPSVQFLPSRDSPPTRDRRSKCPSRSSLTAQPAMATTVATVVLWTAHSNIPPRKEFLHRATTNTLLRMAHASPLHSAAFSRTLASSRSQPTSQTSLLLPLPNKLFRLPSRLTNRPSGSTSQESSAQDAEPH